MEILLILSGYILACLVAIRYKRKIIKLSKTLANKVHFYVARDTDGTLLLYIGKPIRGERLFYSNWIRGGKCIGFGSDLRMYGLNENDYEDITWECEPLEVFVNMED